MILLVLDSQPNKMTKQDFQELQADLKSFIFTIKIPFDYALERVNEFQVREI